MLAPRIVTYYQTLNRFSKNVYGVGNIGMNNKDINSLLAQW